MKRISAVLFLVGVTATLASLNAGEAKVDFTSRELKTRVESAQTRTEHLQLATYFEQRAQAFLDESQAQAEMVARYQADPMASASKHSGIMMGHRQNLIKALEDGARRMNQFAALHRFMARKARQ